MDTRPIGFFDSGLGGLSVWLEVSKLLPQERCIYLADHAHFPYGNKKSQEVRTLTLNCLERLKAKGAKLIVIACNSATVSGISYYRKVFPSIPLVGVVPAIKIAAKKTKSGKIAVLATPKTTHSSYQRRLIQRFAPTQTVIQIACKEAVAFVERGELQGKRVEACLRKYLQSSFLHDVDTLVLGCTHYPFLKAAISKLVGKTVEILDSAEAVARQVESVLKTKNLMSVQSKRINDEFYTTGNPKHVSTIASILTGFPMFFSRALT